MCSYPYHDLRPEKGEPMSGVLLFPDHESMDRWLVDNLGMSLQEIDASRLPPDYAGRDTDEKMLAEIAAKPEVEEMY